MESWISNYLPLATNSETCETGRTMGQVFWSVILIIGLLKCQQVAKRPTANTTCLSALAAALTAFLLASIASIFRP